MKPLAIELFAGTGSGTAGHVELGGTAICFDLEYLPHHGDPAPGSHRVIQDVLTLHGSQFKDATFIWASPPCQKYSYLAMPWSRSADPENSKAAKALRNKWETEGPDNRLFDACFRIQREASEAAGRYIPMIVENVRGAVPWVGQQKAKFGSFYLWGDVEQLGNRVIAGRDLADIRAGRGRFGMGVAPEKAQKREGRNFHTWELTGGAVSSPSFHGGEHETRGVGLGQKRNPDGTDHPQGSWFGIADSKQGDRRAVKVPGQIHGKEYAMCRTGAEGQTTLGGTEKIAAELGLTNQAESDAVRAEATKIGGDWFSDPNSTCRKHGSKSNARKAASALIARIPKALSDYIARQFWPT